MKKLYILLLLILPAFCFAQTVDSLKRKKVEIGVSFSPDVAYRNLKGDAESKELTDLRDTLEVPKFGYTVGANVNFKLSKKFNLETGILFSDQGQRTKKQSPESVPAGQQPVTYIYNFHYYYLTVPVKADYYFLTGKLKFYVTAGVTANFFLGQKITAITGLGNRTTRTSEMSDPGFSSFHLGMVAGCGIRYPVGARTSLMVEPVYRRSLTSITTAPVKGYLYSAGLNIGIYYNL